MPIINVPNSVTLLRLLLIVPFVVFLAKDNVLWSIILFIIISALDGVDGFLARYTKQQSRFGEIFDGASDIIILIAAFLACGHYGYIEQKWHLLLIVIPLFLLLAKIIHVSLTKETEHTIAGKINAVLAYLTIITSLFPFINFSIVIGLFLLMSVYTTFSFLFFAFKHKKST